MANNEISPLTSDPKWYCWKIVDDAIAASAIEDARQQPEQSPGMNLKAFMDNWKDVLAEEEVSESIVSAHTLAELAEKLGWNAERLQADIDEYNAHVNDPAPAGGPPPMMMEDDEEAPPPMFGTPKPKLPVKTGPFYAIKLGLFHENAVGGMTIDRNASVLKNGTPVPGLYAAGDTTRGIMIPGDVGVGYIESVFTALTQALNEGYIAGVEAAKHTA